jgi:hypothetical protein
LLNLCLGGTVEASAQLREKAQDLRVWVALYGIVRLDASQMLLPALMLAVDLAQVGDEEGVLFAIVACVVINALHAGLEGFPDQLLSVPSAMVDLTAESIVVTLYDVVV